MAYMRTFFEHRILYGIADLNYGSVIVVLLLGAGIMGGEYLRYGIDPFFDLRIVEGDKIIVERIFVRDAVTINRQYQYEKEYPDFPERGKIILKER